MHRRRVSSSYNSYSYKKKPSSSSSSGSSGSSYTYTKDPKVCDNIHKNIHNLENEYNEFVTQEKNNFEKIEMDDYNSRLKSMQDYYDSEKKKIWNKIKTFFGNTNLKYKKQDIERYESEKDILLQKKIPKKYKDYYNNMLNIRTPDKKMIVDYYECLINSPDVIPKNKEILNKYKSIIEKFYNCIYYKDKNGNPAYCLIKGITRRDLEDLIFIINQLVHEDDLIDFHSIVKRI